MLKRAYDEAKALLLANRIALDRIAHFLIEKETITGKEFMDILRRIQRGGEAEVPSLFSEEEKKEIMNKTSAKFDVE